MDFVLDASVVLKWFFDEEYSANAGSLLERLQSGVDRARAPELLLAEAAHVLRKRRGQHKIAKEDVWDQWATFLLVPVDYSPIAPLMLDAFSLAIERGITAYDALYVQLALDLDLPVMTSDGGIWSNFGPSGRAIHISSVSL